MQSQTTNKVKIPKPELDKRIVPNELDLPTMTIGDIKLKDKAGRDRVVIDCMRDFGFLPETIVIDKVAGANNKINIHAVIPKVKNGKKTE